MKQVSWTVKCMTLVNVDDDDEAAEAVGRMFEAREFPAECGKCLATLENMAILDVMEAKVDLTLNGEPIREH